MITLFRFQVMISSLSSAETSLPRSLCPEMCMICKKKDLKLKHSRQNEYEMTNQDGKSGLYYSL